MKRLLVLLIASLLVASTWAHNAILLENVRALTFHNGRMTTARRTSPVPQLNCVGGSASYRSELHPDVVQCINQGTDSFGEVQWKCEAEMDSKVRFGDIQVVCEGYSHSEDRYVLQGSCGLEYNLELTSAGKSSNSYNSHSSWDYNPPRSTSYHSESNTFSSLFSILIMGFVVYAVVRAFRYNAATDPHYQNRPSAFYPNNPVGYYPGSSYPSSYASGFGPTGSPGFFSGLAGGATLGYLFGRNRGYNNYYAPRPSYGFGGWGSGPSAAPSSGSTTRTTSGFGGTKKR